MLYLDTNLVHKRLLDWYAVHYRPLPWRADASPYRVWVSEIMLQQTRIEAVIPYFHRFISALPDVCSLAAVDTEQLLKLWEGLGYYSRARNLKKAAQKVVDEFSGKIPADYDLLLSLPGVGEYTAGAIASIAFSIPVPAVDGNVMRILARLTADDTDVLSSAGKKKFTDLAWQMVPEQEAGRFNQALMELGETICTPKSPRCECCPIRSECVAFLQNEVDRYPVRIKKSTRRIEDRALAVVIEDSIPPKVLIHKRDAQGLLADLWELPNTLEKDALFSVPPDIRSHCLPVKELPDAKHLFSHIEWHMKADLFIIDSFGELPKGYYAATLDELQSVFPLPGAFRAYTALFPELLKKENEI